MVITVTTKDGRERSLVSKDRAVYDGQWIVIQEETVDSKKVRKVLFPKADVWFLTESAS